MKASASKRVLVAMMALSMGSLPAFVPACPSGATQETLLDFAWDTYAWPPLENYIDNNPAWVGRPVYDWAMTIVKAGIGQWVGRQIDFAVPDDPFGP